MIDTGAWRASTGGVYNPSRNQHAWRARLWDGAISANGRNVTILHGATQGPAPSRAAFESRQCRLARLPTARTTDLRLAHSRAHECTRCVSARVGPGSYESSPSAFAGGSHYVDVQPVCARLLSNRRGLPGGASGSALVAKVVQKCDSLLGFLVSVVPIFSGCLWMQDDS